MQGKTRPCQAAMLQKWNWGTSAVISIPQNSDFASDVKWQADTIKTFYRTRVNKNVLKATLTLIIK